MTPYAWAQCMTLMWGEPGDDEEEDGEVDDDDDNNNNVISIG